MQTHRTFQEDGGAGLVGEATVESAYKPGEEVSCVTSRERAQLGAWPVQVQQGGHCGWGEPGREQCQVTWGCASPLKDCGLCFEGNGEPLQCQQTSGVTWLWS